MSGVDRPVELDVTLARLTLTYTEGPDPLVTDMRATPTTPVDVSGRGGTEEPEVTVTPDVKDLYVCV